MLELIFWGLILFIFYAYFGYPMVLWVWAMLRPKSVKKNKISPFVSILICVHNEEKIIRQKLENCLSLDYPKERLEIIVATDGCTDKSNEIVRNYDSLGIKLLDYTKKRGKVSVLNDSIPRCSGEIIVLADARQRFDNESVKELVANFHDPKVGAASGELHLLEKSDGAVGKSLVLYWRYEKMIRHLESRVDSVAGATGAFYAIRKCLYEPIPSDTLLDDVLIPLNIIRKGYRVIFESNASVYDEISSSRHEYKRKVRTLAGNYQLLFHHGWMFNPLINRIAVQLISHRLFLRILMPFVLILIFLINIGLNEGIYRISLLLQTLFYSISFIGILFSRSKWNVFALPCVYFFFNFSALVGFVSIIRKRHTSLWLSKSDN